MGRWVAYGLLAALAFPTINLMLDLAVFFSLGAAVALLLFPALIAGESVTLRRLVHRKARAWR